jgi:F-type H+-transporting ATPase subunit b
MLRRAIVVFGIGCLCFGLAVLLRTPAAHAVQGPQEKVIESKPKAEAEAEPGHPAPAAGHGAAEGKTNPMEVQPSMALWTFVVFLGLFFLLGRFAWKPISQALHQREEHLEHCLLQTENARNESERLLAEHKRLMASVDDRVKLLLDNAKNEAQARGEEIIKTAQSEAEAARERAKREIGAARDQALAEIWTQTANMAVSVAGRVLTKQLNEDDHRRLLDLAMKELPAAPAAPNGKGGSHA